MKMNIKSNKKYIKSNEIEKRLQMVTMYHLSVSFASRT